MTALHAVEALQATGSIVVDMGDTDNLSGDDTVRRGEPALANPSIDENSADFSPLPEKMVDLPASRTNASSSSMTGVLDNGNFSPTVTIEGLRPTLGLDRARIDSSLPPPPSLVERLAALTTIFVVIHGLPIDWFQTRLQFTNSEGNLRGVVADLALMSLGIARIAGYLDWLIRAVKLNVYLFAIAAMALLSTLWSFDSFETVKQATIFVTVTTYGAYLVLRFTLHDIIKLLAKVFTIGGVINLAFVFAFPAFGSYQGLWDGVFFQKNALGYACMLAIPILLIAAREGGPGRHIYYLSAVVQAVLLYGSDSKTMMVAAGASVVLLITVGSLRSSRTLRGAVVLVVLGSVLMTVALATVNLGALTDWLDKDTTLTGRTPLWQALFPVILERPLLGHGFRAVFGGYFSPSHDVWLTETWKPRQAHNTVIQVIAELGLVGAVVFLIGFGQAASRAISTTIASMGLAGRWPLVYLSGMALISITESGAWISNRGWLLFVIAALAASLHGAPNR